MINRLVLDWEGDKYIRVTADTEKEYMKKVLKYFTEHYPEAVFDTIKTTFDLSEVDFTQIENI